MAEIKESFLVKSQKSAFRSLDSIDGQTIMIFLKTLNTRRKPQKESWFGRLKSGVGKGGSRQRA